MNTSDLFLFTAEYPYGTGESFIEAELNVLSSCYSTIFIFPLKRSEKARSVPANVKVIDWSANYQYNGLKTLLGNFFLFRKIFGYEKKRLASKGKTNVNLAQWRSMLLQNIARAERVAIQLEKLKSGQRVFYSYWFDDWATILGVLKEKKVMPSFVSRAHGFDLYDERRKEGLIPFRDFQLQSVHRVFSISKFGADYLSHNYPKYASKIKTSYLGVSDRGTNPFGSENVLRIVSCSNFIPLKRIHLIVEVLQQVKVEVSWLHFGDGPLRKDIESQVQKLPSNIKVEFKGQTKNEDIIRFYNEDPVHLFVNVSETEGIPVTIQEAISFGIPVLATDVGGVKEIVNERTGILVPKDFNVMEIAKLVNEFGSSHRNTLEFRANCKLFWKQTFDAETNYAYFSKELMEA